MEATDRLAADGGWLRSAFQQSTCPRNASPRPTPRAGARREPFPAGHPPQLTYNRVNKRPRESRVMPLRLSGNRRRNPETLGTIPSTKSHRPFTAAHGTRTRHRQTSGGGRAWSRKLQHQLKAHFARTRAGLPLEKRFRQGLSTTVEFGLGQGQGGEGRALALNKVKTCRLRRLAFDFFRDLRTEGKGAESFPKDHGDEDCRKLSRATAPGKNSQRSSKPKIPQTAVTLPKRLTTRFCAAQAKRPPRPLVEARGRQACPKTPSGRKHSGPRVSPDKYGILQ